MTPEELIQGMRELQKEMTETQERCWTLHEELQLAIMKARILNAKVKALMRHREQLRDKW